MPRRSQAPLLPMFFKARSVQQVAILPFIMTDNGIEVLMITSRNRDTWIVPKGWPTRGLPLVLAAAAEAREEAGVLGPVDETPLGTYSYRKRMKAGYSVRCHVFVYPMLVRQHCLDWPELGVRRLKWCRLEEASKLTDERELADILTELVETDGVPLKSLAQTLAGGPDACTDVDETTYHVRKDSFAAHVRKDSFAAHVRKDSFAA